MKVYHEKADALWRRAGAAPEAPKDGIEPNAGSDWLLKSESRVRILLTRAGEQGERFVSKIYRTPPQLAWRTLFMTSRAKREYHNLVWAFSHDLPVVRPLGWSDTRRLGCVRYNQISMGWMPGVNLTAYMKLPGLDPDTRDGVIVQTGEMLARIHRAGIAWGTALPRNVMVQPPDREGSAPRVAAFDFPYAFCTGRDLTGSRSALIDLWWMANGWLTREGFDERSLNLFYSAYADDRDVDASELRRRVERVTRRERRLNRFSLRIAQAFRINRIR